jgi:tRNA(Ile)-lysidine synthase
LIPTLAGYNPNIRGLLAQTASVLAGDEALIAAQVAEAWRRCLLASEPDAACLSGPGFRAAPLGMQRRLVRMAIAELRPGLRDVDFGTVELAVHSALEPPRSQHVELSAGIHLQIEDDTLVFWKNQPPRWKDDGPQMAVEPLQFTLPADLELGDGWRLAGEKVTLDGKTPWLAAQANGFEAWLDASEIAADFGVRRMAPGDRFTPLGMRSGSIKLSDFLTNKKLPRRLRAAWPLVVVGDEIAWLPGFCPAEKFKVSANCLEAFHLWVYLSRQI